jgi:hypothetical protein
MICDLHLISDHLKKIFSMSKDDPQPVIHIYQLKRRYLGSYTLAQQIAFLHDVLQK